MYEQVTGIAVAQSPLRPMEVNKCDSPRQPEITEQVEYVQSQLGQLEAVVAQLGERLRPVSREDVPTAPGCLDADKGPQTELGRAMRAFGNAVRQYRTRVENILDRLEV